MILEDKESKGTIKNARKKLETLVALAMLCKASKKGKHGATRGNSKEIQSKLACILEASESTIMRMEEYFPNYHEDHIAGRGTTHCNITIWYTMKIPSANAAVVKEWENLEKDSSVGLDKGQKQIRGDR